MIESRRTGVLDEELVKWAIVTEADYINFHFELLYVYIIIHA